MASVTDPDDADRHETAGTRHVARGGLANLVGAGYAGVASFVTTLLVARIATTEDAGIYFAAVSVLLIAAALAELGVPVGYVYFLARFRGLGEQHRLRAILTAGAIPVLAVGAIVATVGFVLQNQLGTLLFGDDVDGATTLVVLLASGLVIAIVADCTLGATRGLGVMRPTVVADKFVNPSVQLLALVLLAVIGWTGGEQLVWTRILGFIAVAVIALPWLARLLRRHPMPAGASFRETWIPDRRTFAEFWRFTVPRAFGQIAQVGIQRIDIVLVALWLSPSEAAVYAAATRFLVFGQLAANAIGTAVQPRISTLSARGEMGSLKHLYRTSTAWVMFATWPLYLTFLVQAEWLMGLFGPDYVAGATVLQILSAAMLVATACGAVDAVLLMAGRSTLTMINSWIALAVNIGLNIWLIPQLGIVGAAVSWVAAILVNNLLPLTQVLVVLRVHPFGRITLLAGAVPLVLFGLAPWVTARLGAGAVGAVIVFSLAAAVYALLLWRWRHALGLDGLLRRARRGRSSPDHPEN
jgi:O-antigen/teichoic acid export membrane protein